MNKFVLTLASTGLVALALTGCKREPEPATVAPVATPVPTAPAPQVVEATASTSDLTTKVGDIDVKAFAGKFTGTLPCASCPGIDTTLELSAEGQFKLTETYQGEKDGTFNIDGSWTVEDGGKRVLLDPNSKSDEDRSYEIVSSDEIRMLGKDGKPVESTLNYSLKRASM